MPEILKYDPKTGEVRVRRNNRLLIADHDGLVYVFDSNGSPKSVKYKLDKLAYYLWTQEFPSENCRILHRNLDDCDNRAVNLLEVSRGVYNKIKEASKNLDHGIRIINHPTDQMSHILLWYEGGQEKERVIEDIVVAKRLKTRLQLRYSKFLTKYCMFDS